VIPGLGLWTLAHVYLFWRISSVPFFTRRARRLALAVALTLLWASFLLDRSLGWLEVVGVNWLAILFFTLVCLVAADLVTAFGFLLRRWAPAIRGWALAAAGVLTCIALVQGLRAPVARDYTVHLRGLPAAQDSTVLVVVSDLHLGNLLGERWLAARVAQVNALHPDLVVALGDIVEGHGGAESTIVAGLRRLSPPLGVWAVTGNHEYHGGRGLGHGPLEAAGFNVLHDRWAEVRPGLVLAGVDDLTSRHRAGRDSGAVLRALAGRPAGAAVLLSHTPWQAEDAAKAGAALMLAAHTHGGQIWPFNYLSATRYPLQAGPYLVDGMPVIVSRGTGTWGPRMRLWRPSEILRVTLRAGEASPARLPLPRPDWPDSSADPSGRSGRAAPPPSPRAPLPS
jgi:predicted MPP superfamily phosphohydrolase